MKDNEGFTLVELIVAIVLLALVAGIGAYAITSIIKSSKEENYNLLIKNITGAAETYYQECRYSRDTIFDMVGTEAAVNDFCDNEVTLNELLTYGYLEGNAKDDNGIYRIENPLDNSNISDCVIAVNYSNGKLNISFGEENCPTKDVTSGSDNPSSEISASSSSLMIVVSSSSSLSSSSRSSISSRSSLSSRSFLNSRSSSSSNVSAFKSSSSSRSSSSSNVSAFKSSLSSKDDGDLNKRSSSKSSGYIDTKK